VSIPNLVKDFTYAGRTLRKSRLLTLFVTRDCQFTRQEGRIELLREIRARLRALPGVENASESLALPLGGRFSSPGPSYRTAADAAGKLRRGGLSAGVFRLVLGHGLRLTAVALTSKCGPVNTRRSPS
jgi:hypothetical protein